MIHIFKSGNLNIVLDVNSNALYVFDDLSYNILDYWPDQKKIFSELKNNYSREEIQECIDEIKNLEDEGLLFTKDFAPEDYNLKNYEPVIKAMCLNIAHACNLKCKYCFAEEGNYHGKKSLMSFEVGKQAIDFLIQNSKTRKNLEIDFFGGEPLLNFDVVKKIISYAREQEKIYDKNFRFTITTNGVLLDQEKIDYINKNMFNVVLSLDGRKKTHDKMRPSKNNSGSYDIIVPNFLKFISQRGTKNYYVRGTFTHYNLDFTEDILHLYNLGFKNISMEPVVADENCDYALKKQDLNKIFSEYDKLLKIMIENNQAFNFFHFMIDLNNGPCFAKRIVGCGAGTEYIAVDPIGDFYPCHQFVGLQDFKIGNVFDKDKSEKYFDIRKKFKACNIGNKKKCQKCWAKFYCSGGCIANAYNSNKNLYEPYDYACELQKKRLECALTLKAIQALKNNSEA